MALLAIILGSLFGGALVGGGLYLFDPLGTRRPHIAGDDTAAQALGMLGYLGEGAVLNFQRDANYVLAWERDPRSPSSLGDSPPALWEIGAGPDLALTGMLDDPTVTFVLAATRAVVLATGQPCMTAAAVEANLEVCKSAWQDAVRYAYQATTAPQATPLPGKVILTYVPMPQNGGGLPGPGLAP